MKKQHRHRRPIAPTLHPTYSRPTLAKVDPDLVVPTFPMSGGLDAQDSDGLAIGHLSTPATSSPSLEDERTATFQLMEGLEALFGPGSPDVPLVIDLQPSDVMMVDPVPDVSQPGVEQRYPLGKSWSEVKASGPPDEDPGQGDHGNLHLEEEAPIIPPGQQGHVDQGRRRDVVPRRRRARRERDHPGGGRPPMPPAARRPSPPRAVIGSTVLWCNPRTAVTYEHRCTGHPMRGFVACVSPHSHLPHHCRGHRKYRVLDAERELEVARLRHLQQLALGIPVNRFGSRLTLREQLQRMYPDVAIEEVTAMIDGSMPLVEDYRGQFNV